MAILGVRALLPEERLPGEVVDDRAEHGGSVGGEAAGAADHRPDHRLRLLVDVQANPVVGADHPGQEVLPFVQELHVAGRRADLRAEQRLDHPHERCGVEHGVAVDGDDVLRVVVEQPLRRVEQRLPLPGVLRELVQPEAELVRERPQPRLDAVRRAVVDDDHLLLSLRVDDGADRPLDEVRLLVEHRDQDGDLAPGVPGVPPGAQIVDEQKREQVAGVRDEDERVAGDEVIPEPDVEEVLRQVEGRAAERDRDQSEVQRTHQLVCPSRGRKNVWCPCTSAQGFWPRSCRTWPESASSTVTS